MQHTENTFTGHDGLKLFYQSWRPDTAPKAVLIIIHGLGEHSGRYLNFVKPLVAQGYAIYACDNRGHGRSPGRRGYVNRFNEFQQDVIAFQEVVTEQEGKRPLFLMGHSLGGLISLYTVLHNSSGLTGVIASAPALDTGGIPAVLMATSKILSHLKPNLTVPSGLDITAMSRDPKAVQAYQADPLIHSVGTPRLATESAAAIKWCLAHPGNLKIPILIIHGTDDRITSPISSREFFDKLTISDKTYINYEGGYHENHNDLHHAQATADIQAWLDAHL
ncbi:MAG: lysophospholipase [Chloroflexi bacterium]|nr:MAG: lysophospholipase [Chloroflexota bacterium]